MKISSQWRLYAKHMHYWKKNEFFFHNWNCITSLILDTKNLKYPWSKYAFLNKQKWSPRLIDLCLERTQQVNVRSKPTYEIKHVIPSYSILVHTYIVEAHIHQDVPGVEGILARTIVEDPGIIDRTVRAKFSFA